MTTQPLPETKKAAEYPVPVGDEMAFYQKIVLAHEFEAASVVGVVPSFMSFRIYGERVMWRLTFTFDTRLTRDEVRAIAFRVCTKCFGAWKPEFFRPDDGRPDAVVAVWFTNGSNLALKSVPF